MKYYVWSGDQWVKCSKAKEANKGFLEYELDDGTTGLASSALWQKLVGELIEKKKRPVGRPLTGKSKILISLDPVLVQAIDDKASISNMSRSEFIGIILSRALAKKQ